MSRSTREAARNLFGIALGQGGYFTAKQAQEAGYGYPHLEYHVSTDAFERIEHGLYRLKSIPPVENDELIRVSLWSRNRDDQRAVLYGHIHTVRRQLGLPAAGSDVKYKSKREGIAEDIPDVHCQRGVSARLNLLGPLDAEIRRLETDIERAANRHVPAELAALQTIPGVGPILSLTIVLEIDTVERFESRQQFCSYARLVTPKQESGGKIVGVGNAKAGNAWLKWAFSEAAVLSAQKDERMNRVLERLKAKHGAGRGLSVFAHKLGRVAYHLLKRKAVFDVVRFARG